MISLDQVLLLQDKVETAVLRIKELTDENRRLASDNDALRSKCAELSKALEDKTELVSTLESDQTKIEAGILNALSRLDTVENSVLSAGSINASSINASSIHASNGQANFQTAAESPESPTAVSSAEETEQKAEEEAVHQATGTQQEEQEEKAPSPTPQSIDNQFDIF